MILRRYLFPATLLFCFALGYFIATQNQPTPRQAVVDITVIPSNAKVTIDGKKAKSGKNTVPVGSHKIEATMKGFSDATQTKVFEQGDNTLVGLALQSNSDSTKSWYADHPEEAKAAEGLSDKLNDQTASNTTANFPIFQSLPVSFGNGSGGRIEFSAGLPVEKSSEQAVYVTANSKADKQSALQWITSNGYDTSSVDYVFISEVDQLLPNEVLGSD